MHDCLNFKQRGKRRGPEAFFRWATKNTQTPASCRCLRLLICMTTVWIMNVEENTHTHAPRNSRKLKIPNKFCSGVKWDSRWRRKQRGCNTSSVNTGSITELHVFFEAPHSKGILWLAQAWLTQKRNGKSKEGGQGWQRAAVSNGKMALNVQVSKTLDTLGSLS